MQEAMIALVNADRLSSAFELKPFALCDQRLSSPRYFAGSGDDALFRCSSPFSPSFGFSSPSPHATSVSLSPSSSASIVDDGDATAAADDVTGHRLQLARLALHYQEVADRYQLCLARLAEAVDEAEALRRENAELRVANGDIARRLALLGGKQAAAVAVAEETCRLRRCEQQSAVPFPAECAPPENLGVLPKSISVRSKDYLKMNLPAKAPATPVANNRKPRAANPTVSNHSSVSLCSVPALPFLANSRVAESTAPTPDTIAFTFMPTQQRLYVGADAGAKGEEAKEQRGVELEVYNQGMFKTELCNKWEETGACPYGNQCQFAHGVAELRPVIRHPRYKTQVCRMVLAGEPCPYGHRCHFRHTLTPAERLLLPRP
jgi:butyrate response factor